MADTSDHCHVEGNDPGCRSQRSKAGLGPHTLCWVETQATHTHSHTHRGIYTKNRYSPHTQTHRYMHTHRDRRPDQTHTQGHTEHTDAHRHHMHAYTRTPIHSLQHCWWAQQPPAQVCRPASGPCPSISAPLGQLRIRERLPEPAPSPL